MPRSYSSPSKQNAKPLRSSCGGVTAEREAMEGSLAQKQRELDRLESQRLSAHQVAQAALEEDRKCLAERDRQLALRGSELQWREEQCLQTEKDLAAQREALEAREGGLAQATSKFDEHVAAQKRSDERSERRFAKRTRAAQRALTEHERHLRRPFSRSTVLGCGSGRTASRPSMLRTLSGSLSSRRPTPSWRATSSAPRPVGAERRRLATWRLTALALRPVRLR